MTRLRTFAGNPLVLLMFLICGGTLGLLFPSYGRGASLVGQLYLSVISLAALPLLVVATFFGLRQVWALPKPGWRLIRLLTIAISMVLGCAVLGACAGYFTQTGEKMHPSEQRYLGGLVLQSTGGASDEKISLSDSGKVAKAAESKPLLSKFVPENFFAALAQGQLLCILIGSLCFGAAIVSHTGGAGSALMNTIEAIYRSMEEIISKANLLIPLLVFGLAATFVSNAQRQTLVAMGSFLGTFAATFIVISALAVFAVWKKTHLSLDKVLAALKTPALISFFSASATAAIPDSINAISSKLGFSRGATEFIAPLAAVFMRSGAAVYFAILIVFVANLYDQPIGYWEFLLICGGATLAALASAGTTGFATLAFAGSALHLLNLPVEAVLPLFLVIDLICDGPRNLITFFTACVLIAFVTENDSSEKTESSSALPLESESRINFTFSQVGLVVVGGCTLLAAILITIAGVGFGMR